MLARVRPLQSDAFTLNEMYASEDRLSRLHPDNPNVHPKIRQQLQVLRTTASSSPLAAVGIESC